MKRFFRTIHLYLGLASGLVIMVTCFTGAMLAFEKELQHSIYPERYEVNRGEKRASIAQMIDELKRHVPEAKVSGVKVFTDEARSVEINYTLNEKGSGGKDQKKSEKPAPSTTAFMNPYTGDVISLYTHQHSFFYTMFSLHRWLLAGDTGKLIVGISTSIFLFILITGIILWWPKKKKFRQRVTLKLSAGWKRINHDLHITIGFYCAIFLFIMAFTGLAWSFKWFNDGIYWITGTESKRPDAPLSEYRPGELLSYDQALASITALVPNAEYFSITLAKDSVGAVAVSSLSQNPVHEKASDMYYLDQHSGQLIGMALYSDRNLGQRVRSLFYPIHVGSIAGIPGRIIAFLACIAGVTFPITGVIMWINRLRKKERKKLRKTRGEQMNQSSVVSPKGSRVAG
jgi:uncharacterized iron-regulated membrane protein